MKLLFVLFLVISFNCFSMTPERLEKLGFLIFSVDEKYGGVYSSNTKKLFINDIYEAMGYEKTKKWLKEYELIDTGFRAYSKVTSSRLNVGEIIRGKLLAILEKVREEDLKCGRAFN